MKQRVEEIHSIQQREIIDLRVSHRDTLNRLHQSIRRVAQRPVAVPRHGLEEPVQHVPRAEPTRQLVRLSARPKNLYDLYHEYEFGLGGSKPAKMFTSAERGACRFTYSLRLGFWTLVDDLVRKGRTSEVAIDLVYSVYGANQPVVSILRAIRVDKKRGGHPALR